MAATAPDVQGSSQQHQVEVPGLQHQLMSSALASSRAELHSPLPQSAPQCCCSSSQIRNASRRVPVGTGSRNTCGLSLVTTAQRLCAPHSSAGRSQQDPPLPQSPGSSCFHSCSPVSGSRTLPHSIHVTPHLPGVPGEVLEARQVSRQSLSSSSEEGRDEGG